jgi:pimeloyl-ACP methyl ester carboxylesterase
MNEPAIEKKHISTSFGTIAYVETGRATRPPVLFIHGIPTSSYLWRDVVRFLQNDLHCYAPDLMGLGDTDVDPDATAFHMDAQAEMLIEFMSALGHEEFAIVCHDQGGAAAQIIAARQPQRVTALVLTDCVCYDNWPVRAVQRLQALSRWRPVSEAFSHSGIGVWLETSTRLSAFKKGVFDKTKLSTATIREYLRPFQTRIGRARFRAFVLAGHPRYTQLAVDGLRAFDKPTLVVWAADDRYLSPSWGRKLYEEIPGANEFRLVPFCGHFWQEERPSEFASVIGEFLTRTLAAQPVSLVDEAPLDADCRVKTRARLVKLPVIEPTASSKD